ncbi:MAG: sodium:alanine symporter family protein [Clostridia bacterium]|nr:sodium:alanine symporter family protein [Clostridia bacterium]
MIIGGIFLIFLLAAGGYTGCRLKWFCFCHPVLTVKRFFSPGREDAARTPAVVSENETSYSPMKALTVALAGTLGVGNITGVAAAIALGGAGALFWMWISALCTMLIKYAEVYLAVKTRERIVKDGKTEYRGGPMRYFQYFRCGGMLASVFCGVCIAASFVQGNLLQTAAAVSCADAVFGQPSSLTAGVLTVCAVLLIFGGRQRIASFTEKMIPLMTALYFGMGMLILFRNAALLPQIGKDILSSAFSVKALGGGGIGGISIILAMRHGCAKGVFSHEAGCGTSPISHAGADTDDPCRQGILGIAEVFVDTIVLCTVTGLVLLVSGFGYGGGTQGYALAVMDAFSLWFGNAAKWILGLSIVFYAFATLVCWSFYGTECVRYFCRKANRSVRKWETRYLLFYSICTFFGAFVSEGVLWGMSDVLTMTMTVINTAAVLGLLTYVKTPGLDRTETKKIRKISDKIPVSGSD